MFPAPERIDLATFLATLRAENEARYSWARSWGWGKSVVAGLVVGEVVVGDDAEPVGLVGVADERSCAVGDEHLVMLVGFADGGEVGGFVAAAPGAGNEVVDLEAVAGVAGAKAAVAVA